jgi:hypothetical protein
MLTQERLHHPATGRFMAGDCERDCLERCAGLCGVDSLAPVIRCHGEGHPPLEFNDPHTAAAHIRTHEGADK